MKKSFFLIVLTTLTTLFSCQNNIEQYRAGIEELGSKWDATTASANSFSEMLGMENDNFTGMMSKMDTDDTMLSKLSEEEQTKVKTAKESLVNAGSEIGKMKEAVTTFTAEWTAKGAEVVALKEGLASGKLEGDVTTKLAELSTYVADAGTKVTEWTGQLETLKSQIASSQSNYSSLVAQLAPSE